MTLQEEYESVISAQNFWLGYGRFKTNKKTDGYYTGDESCDAQLTRLYARQSELEALLGLELDQP